MQREILVRVTRQSEADVMVCRDCGLECWRGDSQYWPFTQRFAMHSHRKEDGTWTRGTPSRRAKMYALVAS